MPSVHFDPEAFIGKTEEQLLAEFSDAQIQQFIKWCSYINDAPLDARKSLLKFARYTAPDPDFPYDIEHSLYDVQPHHRLIAEALEEVMTGKLQYLAISMPPQVGKTELCVRKFLPYHVGHYPWKHIITGTFNSTFSEEHGDDVRTVINSDEYKRIFPGVHMRQGSKAKDHMVTTRGGKISFIGREGTGSGRPADGLVVDDPLKDDKEAASKTIRDASWNWYTRVAENRCHSMSWRIIVSTRWSDDDLIARLTDPKNPFYNESVAREWTVINVPQIMDNADIAAALGKKVGDMLWPERFSRELAERRKRMDPVGFSAMHQGRPTPPDGSYFKRQEILTYESAREFPKNAVLYMTGDLAVSTEKFANRSCVGIWALDENDVLWLSPDLYWDRKSADESVENIIEKGCQYGIMDAFFEKGQIDKAIGPFLEKRMQEELEAGKKVYWQITRLAVSGNKNLKTQSIRGRMRQGKVRFPAFATWWLSALEEILKFTGSGDDKADDFVDMCALIGQALESQIKATTGAKIIEFPKTGTLAWTKWASTHEKAERKRYTMSRGM